MAVKLTKNELKVQKDRLKQFQRYLPTLQLKKQQLQSVVMQVTAQLEQVEQQRRAAVAGLDDWVAVFAENDSFPADKRLETLIRPHHVVCGQENIAGVTVPVFQELSFEEIQYDVADYPLWVDTAAVRLREIARLDALEKTLRRQVELLEQELRSTAQRVNLFEKVKIPEAKENIRVIGIYLGDQQTSAVVRGKIAKKKLQEVREGKLRELEATAQATGLAEDAQAAKDLADKCNRFEKKIYDLELTRTISIQTAPQIRMIQNNDNVMVEKIQTTLMNTIPLWKNQMVLALGIAHSNEAAQAQRQVNDITNALLKQNAEKLHMASVETAKEAERGIVDIETLKKTNAELIQTLDDVMKIQSEGREKRIAAEAEMAKMDNDLKGKLLEIRGGV